MADVRADATGQRDPHHQPRGVSAEIDVSAA
jgi:hypothetical protein